MDIVRFKGGLGNQMFQYAFLKSLSRSGRSVKGNLGFYRKHPELMKFCLTEVFPNISIDFVEDSIFNELDEMWKEIKSSEENLPQFLVDYPNRFFWVENPEGEYNKHVFDTRNCAFVGYWQTEKYFSHIRNTLLKDFSFRQGDTKFEVFKQKLRDDRSYVSVHIRRGDYLMSTEAYGELAATEYYKNAMEYINARVSNPKYVYFSDDMQWVKENFEDDKGIFIEDTLFDNYSAWYDMCLMSCCASNIIANSSFSWWGAWLNVNPNKIVIAPNRWLMNRSTPDIWCEDWIRM